MDVVVIGNAGIDTCVYLHGDRVDEAVEANFTHNVDAVGQAGGYASRGYAALGYATAFVGALGTDPAGHQVRERLEREGIDLGGVFHDPAGTARSVNLVFRDGRRKNFYDGKGHMTLNPDLATLRPILAGARLAHVNIPNWARQLLPLLRELGVRIAVDLQDVVSVDDPYRADFVDAADILFFSAANHPDPAPVMHAYWARNPRLTQVVGMGERGCALGLGGAIRFFAPPPLDWPVLDTNGAGDALAVGYLAATVLEGLAPDVGIAWGQTAARHICAQRAPKSLIPHWPDGGRRTNDEG
jgi:sugar/nucleoside kinase (ribokinase family)